MPLPPTNVEHAVPVGDQLDVNVLIQTLLARIDRQDALTRETNERLDALSAAQAPPHDQLGDIQSLNNRTSA